MTYLLPVLALIASLALAGEVRRVSVPEEAVASHADDAVVAVHDFHVSYGRMAVEDASIAVRFRFFSDDLEKSIRSFTADDMTTITDDPSSWTPFASYLSGTFRLVADGDTLGGAIIGSGEEIMDKEPVRWFLVQYTAADTVHSIGLSNRLLFEQFDDQKNIVQFRHFPSEKNGSLYFTHDRPSYTLEF